MILHLGNIDPIIKVLIKAIVICYVIIIEYTIIKFVTSRLASQARQDSLQGASQAR